jgi:hypothetical protein
MEVLGQGLIALGDAVGSIAAACGFIGVAAIAAGTFLVYTGKTTFEDVARFVKMFRKGGGSWPR